MRRPPERNWPGLIAGYLLLLAGLGGLTTFLYVSVGDAQKELVIRLAVAALSGVIFLHIHSRVRRGLDNAPFSEFERALRPEPMRVTVDPLLLKLRDELRYSVESRRYFEEYLWPRLAALGAESGKTTREEPPSAGWLRRRGPSLRELEELIKHLEAKP